MKRIISLAFVFCVLTIALTACGTANRSATANSALVEHARKLNAEYAVSNTGHLHHSVTADGDTLKVIHRYGDHDFDKAQAKSELEAAHEQHGAMLAAAKKAAPNVRAITVEYHNHAGKVMHSKTFR